MKKSVAVSAILVLAVAIVAAVTYGVIQRGYAVELADELARAEREARVAEQAVDGASFLLEEEEEEKERLAEAIDSCRIAIIRLAKAGSAWTDAASEPGSTFAVLRASDGLRFTEMAHAPSNRCYEAWRSVN